MNDSWRHHFVPQFLLRNFVISGSNPQKIWEFDFTKIRGKDVSPKGTAFVPHLYTIEDTPEREPTYWENQFKKLENTAAPIIKKILQDCGGQNLSREEKTEFARFVGYSFVRTPQFFRQQEQAVAGIYLAAEEACAGNQNKLRAIADQKKEDPETFCKKFMDLFKQGQIPNKKQWLENRMNFINSSGQKIAEIILNDTTWFFYPAQDGKSFCIADDPVAIFTHENGQGWRHGIGHTDAELYLPLSPKICFIAYREPRKYPKNSTEEINEIMIWQAFERIYGSQEIIHGDLLRRSKIELIQPRYDWLSLYSSKYS